MSEEKIIEYFGSRKAVGLYQFKGIRTSNNPLFANDAMSSYFYYPPQNFQRIDQRACQSIDEHLFGRKNEH